MPICACYSDTLRAIQFRAALQFAEDIFNVKTARANPCNSCCIKEALTSKIIREVGANEETLEVSEIEYLQINNQYSGGIVGYYDPEYARIFLINGKWCISHIIHETLHSRCVFCVKGVTSPGLISVIEGLNELLTGVVMKSVIPKCYDFWKLKNHCFCEPYLDYLKTWYYLSFRIPFTAIVSLYFNMKEKNPIQELEKILTHETGYLFENIFVIKRPYESFLIQQKFVNFLENHFDDFAEFYKTPLKRINLEHIKI
jgi:hypothetical protein